MTVDLNMTAGSRIEFGFGTVTPGKEAWMYGEYFPSMGPTMAKHGLTIMAVFSVIGTNYEGSSPQSGSLASWPSAAARADLHTAPVFMDIQPARDVAMEMLSGGHLFEALDEVITLNTDSDYAFVITAKTEAVPDPIFVLPLTEDSTEQTYAGNL